MADKYRAARTGDFVQAKPELRNTFLEDQALRSMLRRLLPTEAHEPVEQDLLRLGARCATDLAQAARECELQPPTLERYDGWGEHVDEVRTCSAWRSMKQVCAEEGLVATGYRRPYGQFSRVVQAAKLLLFAPSSGLYSCPLAMTDGAAKLLEGLLRGGEGTGLKVAPAARGALEEAFERLTSTDPARFITSGQWMTERRGGSDVAHGTDTYAVPEPGAADGAASHRLYGYKWFTSATDADMSITLARPAKEGAGPHEGNKGLAAFFLWTRDSQSGRLNGLSVEKLKNKLGTRQLPTGELLLDGTLATQLCDEGQGIPQIMVLANVTRFHNAVSSAAGMRRMVQLCRDYSGRRNVLGKPLIEDALHLHTLAEMEVETRAATALALQVALLLGRTEVPRSKEDAKRAALQLRILTPLAKLLTARQAVAVASEGLEAFGGAGYLEDTGLPRMLRDAQVLPIWEGTTNVNALDVFRSVQRSRGQALSALHSDLRDRVAAASTARDGALREAAQQTLAALDTCASFAAACLLGPDAGNVTMLARAFAMLLGRASAAALLLEHAAWSGASEADAAAARRCAASLADGGWASALRAAAPPAKPTVPAKPAAAAPPKRAAAAAAPAADPAAVLAPLGVAGEPGPQESGTSELERISREDWLLVLEGWPFLPPGGAAPAQRSAL